MDKAIVLFPVTIDPTTAATRPTTCPADLFAIALAAEALAKEEACGDNRTIGDQVGEVGSRDSGKPRAEPFGTKINSVVASMGPIEPMRPIGPM
jgi:hypothetical protein